MKKKQWVKPAREFKGIDYLKVKNWPDHVKAYWINEIAKDWHISPLKIVSSGCQGLEYDKQCKIKTGASDYNMHWFCNRVKGHKGAHIAIGVNDIVAVWDAKKEIQLKLDL